MDAPASESPEVSPGLLGPDDIAYRLELTSPELKIVHTALRSLFSDLGHDEDSTRRIVRSVLHKLPDEHAIRAIDLSRGSTRHRL
jgi:hypothetical protein